MSKKCLKPQAKEQLKTTIEIVTLVIIGVTAAIGLFTMLFTLVGLFTDLPNNEQEVADIGVFFWGIIIGMLFMHIRDWWNSAFIDCD